MPAAVLVGGLVALAFAFAAIAAALLIENLVIGPLDSAAAAVSEVAVVGGVLAWMLTALANFIRISLAGVRALVGTAEKQAADWWNFLVNQTVSSQFAWLFQQLSWLIQQEGWITWLEAHMPALWSLTVNSIAPALSYVSSALSALQTYVHGSLAPWISTVQADGNYVRSLVTGDVIPRVGAIGDDLAGLHRWIDGNVVQRTELARAEAATIARVVAIATPIEAAITSIENSPCMKVCEPLGGIGQLLQGLEDAALLAVILGLIDECLHDPVTVQQVLRSTVVPIVTDAANSVGVGR